MMVSGAPLHVFFDKILLEIGKKHQVSHKHGKDGKIHTHGAVAYTLWLDPQLAVRQAQAIQAAFSREMPNHKEVFSANYKKLETDLLSLGKSITKDKEPLLASHPVYQYLQRRFELELKSVHWEPEGAPPAKEWEALKLTLEQYPARWMIWEGAPVPRESGPIIKPGSSTKLKTGILNVLTKSINLFS